MLDIHLLCLIIHSLLRVFESQHAADSVLGCVGLYQHDVGSCRGVCAYGGGFDERKTRKKKKKCVVKFLFFIYF